VDGRVEKVAMELGMSATNIVRDLEMRKSLLFARARVLEEQMPEFRSNQTLSIENHEYV
jgi:hypothetical protein